jgi:hypothetical protein
MTGRLALSGHLKSQISDFKSRPRHRPPPPFPAMNPDETRQLHIFLLATLHASGQVGMTERLALQQTRMQGWPGLTGPQLRQELRSLADGGWALPFHPALGEPRWRATASGVAALQEINLA